MNSLTELFNHELGDIYYAEHKLVGTLGQLAQQSAEPAVQRAFVEHQDQTRGHIARLEKVYATLNEQPQGIVCQGVDGIIAEHASFMQEQPTSPLLQFYDIGAGIKSERYEISAYESLIQLANQINRRDVVPMLEANLKEEQATLERLLGFAQTYDARDGGKLETGHGIAGSIKEVFQH
jgi:ferritin-like metal-binding protein YciE